MQLVLSISIGFRKEPLALYDPDTAHHLPSYPDLQSRVDQADIIILATPGYHGSISGTKKNFLDISGGNLPGSYL